MKLYLLKLVSGYSAPSIIFAHGGFCSSLALLWHHAQILVNLVSQPLSNLGVQSAAQGAFQSALPLWAFSHPPVFE